jgi:putative transposase
VRYAFLEEHRRAFRVTNLCRVLKVSRSGFYAWCRRPPSNRTRANDRLLQQIRRVHLASRENYGAIKTWQALRVLGETCSLNRVARLRQAHGIEARRLRRFRSAYAGRTSNPTVPNLLDRDFAAPQPDRIWAGDVTFISTREGWLYLAVLIDLYSRRVVGWSMGERLNEPLVTAALIMAIEHRQPKPGLVHHTDQGIVYAASGYRAILNQRGIIPSMSRKGDPYDNAVAESFFSNLKNELTWHVRFRTRDEARAAIFDYIEVFYNRQRLHQTLDYITPVHREECYAVS